MSLSDRRSFVIALAGFAGLAGCGFTPAYAPGGAGGRLQGQVLVDEPSTRAGYLMTRAIEGRLGRAADDARYTLSLDISTRREAIAISSSNVTNRYQLLGDVGYALHARDTGKVVAKGRVSSFTSYSASGSPVATLAGARDAEARLMTILSDQIVTRLLALRDLPA